MNNKSHDWHYHQFSGQRRPLGYTFQTTELELKPSSIFTPRHGTARHTMPGLATPRHAPGRIPLLLENVESSDLSPNLPCSARPARILPALANTL